ncbi:MAG: DUF456 family protein [Tumebacillaceae bacterium]
MTIIAICVASLFMLAAVLFTIVPILPGTIFVIPGILLFGMIASFEPFSALFWVGQVVLMLINFLSDNIAQIFGIKKMGGSKAGMIGGTIGMFVLPFFLAPLGPLAIIFGPLLGAVIGAMIGEMLMRRRTGEVVKVGWGSALSFFAGTFLKLILVGIQVSWFYMAI